MTRSSEPTACIVQKYGGTSVGSVEKIHKVAARVARHVAQGGPPVAVVVSAMAGETNRLIELVHETHPQAAARHFDMAVSAGEQISAGLMAAALDRAGCPAEPLVGYQLGIVTDPHHSRARIRHIRTDRIMAAWGVGRVPVIAGFQGVTDDLCLTTLGRGGSDTSAVALAAALGSQLCEINTDVDGVYTADPRIVPAARHLSVLDYDTALEMAAMGSKVLHSRCVELAAKYKVPLVVRSAHDADDARRTIVMALGEEQCLEAPVVSGVTLDKDVARISLGTEKSTDPRLLASVFEAVARHGINVDIIVYDRHGAPASIGFTVSQAELAATLEAIEQWRSELGVEGLRVQTSSQWAKVSAVGLGMRSHAGVASRVFSALAQANIEVVMVSTSEIKISCVVPLAEGERAAQVLHRTFVEQ